MTTLEQLAQWKRAGILTEAQSATISALVRKERFSLFVEIHALLYLGVLSLAAGLGWTFKSYFADLGDRAILTALSAILVTSFYYCFSRGLPYSNGRVESTSPGFDYVLYFACLTFAIELGYLEFRFQLFQNAADLYLLFSAAVFFFLAYRFDNRFVLSMALSSLAGWFGFRLASLGFTSSESLRISAFSYAAIVLSGGLWVYRTGIKKHFLDAYLHVVANVALMAALSGVDKLPDGAPYLAVLLILSGISVSLGFRFRRFAFVVYGIGYGYVGVSIAVLRSISGNTAVLSYFVVTGTLVIATTAVLARRFGREG